MYAKPCGRHCHSGSVCTEAAHASERARDASLIGMPSQSPTYGLPMLSSFPFGVHSPEKSICANAGTPANINATHKKSAAILKRLRLPMSPPENPLQTTQATIRLHLRQGCGQRESGEPYANGP